MLKKARLLTRPTLAVISPSRPESAKTDSLPWDATYPMQGRNFAADPRFTFHASRFTVPCSAARTKLADLFSILLGLHRGGLHATDELCDVGCGEKRGVARRSGENRRDLAQP
jgi:hypothetical protein